MAFLMIPFKGLCIMSYSQTSSDGYCYNTDDAFLLWIIHLVQRDQYSCKMFSSVKLCRQFHNTDVLLSLLLWNLY